MVLFSCIRVLDQPILMESYLVDPIVLFSSISLHGQANSG